MNPDAESEIEQSDADQFADPTGKQNTKGPWIVAGFDSECDPCGGAIFAGDEIRADGSGGWECRAVCGTDDDDPSPASELPLCVSEEIPHKFSWNPVAQRSQCVGCGESDTAELKAQRSQGQYLDEDPPVARPLVSAAVAVLDAFSDPTPAAPPVPEVNVSGQPKARYVWHGKTNRGYQVKLPETGDFRRYKNGSVQGITRVTTFVKAASDSNALTDWAKRNVLIGASKRPDLVAKAHGMTHEDNRGDLMSIVGELETVAGAKVSADIGTQIHEYTERIDGDPNFTFGDIPPGYRPAVALYVKTIRAAGLRPVPGLIERTTYVPHFGGVTGTWDRVYLHEPSGQYVIGDVKTGKTLKYGMDEIEAQEAIYARGANASGAYDWNTDTWRTLKHATSVPGHPEKLTVSEDFGVIIHMPVQGDDAGQCILVKADLQRGWRHAELCAQVRFSRAAKPKPEPWDPIVLRPDLTAAQAPSWDEQFSSVTTVAEAGQLWEKAKAVDVPGPDLVRLVGLAQQRLRSLGITE